MCKGKQKYNFIIIIVIRLFKKWQTVKKLKNIIVQIKVILTFASCIIFDPCMYCDNNACGSSTPDDDGTGVEILRLLFVSIREQLQR